MSEDETISNAAIRALAVKRRDGIKQRCDDYGLESTDLIQYVLRGTTPSNFLAAMLENDFIASAQRADAKNGPKLFQWAIVMYNDVPAGAKGSRAAVDAWCKHRGLYGMMDEPDCDPVVFA